jgi:ribosomal protein L7/L12
LSQHLSKFVAKDAAEDAKKQIEAAGGKASLV